MLLDPEHLDFIRSGVSISLAACGPDRIPCMSRGVGCKVLDDGRRIAVFVSRPQSQELLAYVEASGKVANVFSLPSTNRTVQLKGTDARVLPFDAADHPIVRAHADAFVAELLPLGMPEAIVRTVLGHAPDELVAVVYSPCEAYFQTPGPRAGEPIGTPR